MLTLIATGKNVNLNQFQEGDILAGYYMGKYPFQAKFLGNKSSFISHGGVYTPLDKIEVELLTDCERPQNGLFKAGEKILIHLNGHMATEIFTHSR